MKTINRRKEKYLEREKIWFRDMKRQKNEGWVKFLLFSRQMIKHRINSRHKFGYSV